MVQVRLWSGLKPLADGQEVVEIQGDTIGRVLDNLVAAYPALDPVVQAGVSVALDGQMIPVSRHVPVRPDSEFVLLQRLKGG